MELFLKIYRAVSDEKPLPPNTCRKIADRLIDFAKPAFELSYDVDLLQVPETNSTDPFEQSDRENKCVAIRLLRLGKRGQ